MEKWKIPIPQLRDWDPGCDFAINAPSKWKNGKWKNGKSQSRSREIGIQVVISQLMRLQNGKMENGKWKNPNLAAARLGSKL
jgi:hypothetical protein